MTFAIAFLRQNQLLDDNFKKFVYFMRPREEDLSSFIFERSETAPNLHIYQKGPETNNLLA